MKESKRGCYTTKNGTFGYIKNGRYVICGIDVVVLGLYHDTRTNRFAVRVSFRVGSTKTTVTVGLDFDFVKSLESYGYISNRARTQDLMYYIDERLLLIEVYHTCSESNWLTDARIFVRNTIGRIKNTVKSVKLLPLHERILQQP